MLHRILIVDDDPLIRKALTDFLHHRGYITEAVETGPLALSAVLLFKPDIILLDIFMPGMNGLEVLQRAREIDPDVKVIMLTAASEEHIGHKAIASGAMDFIKKPFHLDQLDTAISVYLLMDTQ